MEFVAKDLVKAMAALDGLFRDNENPTLVVIPSERSALLKIQSQNNPYQISTRCPLASDGLLSEPICTPYIPLRRYLREKFSGRIRLASSPSGVQIESNTGEALLGRSAVFPIERNMLPWADSIEITGSAAKSLLRLSAVAPSDGDRRSSLSGFLFAELAAHVTDGVLFARVDLGLPEVLSFLPPSVVPKEAVVWSASRCRGRWRLSLNSFQFEIQFGSSSVTGSLVVDKFPRPLPTPPRVDGDHMVFARADLLRALRILHSIAPAPYGPISIRAQSGDTCKMSVSRSIATEQLVFSGRPVDRVVPLWPLMTAVSLSKSPFVGLLGDPIRRGVWLASDDVSILLPEVSS
jgi:hypothetical protein